MNTHGSRMGGRGRAGRMVVRQVRRWPALVAGVLLTCVGHAMMAAPATFGEYDVKAVFLLNFAQFVEWPAAAFTTPETPLSIGVLGADPFGEALDRTVQGETVKGHPLVIRRSREVKDLLSCHILYVSGSEKDRLPQVLRQIGGASILTVGESERFGACGGIIRFFMLKNKIRFEINPDAARCQGLRIHAQLLSLGRIVASDGGKEAR